MHITLNSPACGLRLCSIAVGLGSLAHLLRVFVGFSITVGSHAVPAAASIVAFPMLALLSHWLWRLSVPLVTTSTPPATAAPPPATPAAS